MHYEKRNEVSVLVDVFCTNLFVFRGRRNDAAVFTFFFAGFTMETSCGMELSPVPIVWQGSSRLRSRYERRVTRARWLLS